MTRVSDAREAADPERKGRSHWGDKSIWQKAQDVDLGPPIYSAAFGGGSHAVHGNWQDIYDCHLDWDEATGEFTPHSKWKTPRPQITTSLALITIETVDQYFTFMGGPEAEQYFKPLLRDLADRVLVLVDAHESYLAKKAWPYI